MSCTHLTPVCCSLRSNGIVGGGGGGGSCVCEGREWMARWGPRGNHAGPGGLMPGRTAHGSWRLPWSRSRRCWGLTSGSSMAKPQQKRHPCPGSRAPATPEGTQVQERGELGEDDGLGTGIALEHPVDLLPQRLDLGARLELGGVEPRQDALLPESSRGRRRRRRRHVDAAVVGRRKVHGQGLGTHGAAQRHCGSQRVKEGGRCVVVGREG